MPTKDDASSSGGFKAAPNMRVGYSSPALSTGQRDRDDTASDASQSVFEEQGTEDDVSLSE